MSSRLSGVLCCSLESLLSVIVANIIFYKVTFTCTLAVQGVCFQMLCCQQKRAHMPLLRAYTPCICCMCLRQLFLHLGNVQLYGITPNYMFTK